MSEFTTEKSLSQRHAGGRLNLSITRETKGYALSNSSILQWVAILEY